CHDTVPSALYPLSLHDALPILVLTAENVVLVGSLLLFLSVLAGKTSYEFGVPVLIFFLAIGMLAGSEGIGGIYFDDPKIAQFIGDRKSTRLNSSHVKISYSVFC